MASSRALRLLRRPFYTTLCRPRALAPVTPSPPLPGVSSPRAMLSPARVPIRSEAFRTPSAQSLHHPRRFASSPAEVSSVEEVRNPDEYQTLLKEAQEDKKLAVVYFTAKWCGPCRHISPVVNALSQEFGGVKFLKVDLDEEALQKTIELAGIAAVPTFQFHLNGKMVSGFSGADSKKLKDTVQELLEEAKP